MKTDLTLLWFVPGGIAALAITDFISSLSFSEAVLFAIAVPALVLVILTPIYERYSKAGRDKRKRIGLIKELPTELTTREESKSIRLGVDQELKVPIFLPDALRAKHVHILGATGSGKTESVILNFLQQDIARGLGSIILDAKGDISFLKALRDWVPSDRLKVFDLSAEQTLSYDPIAAGSPLEAAQRLFSSLTWSEEYYKSKAFSALQKLFLYHYESQDKNPRLTELDRYLRDAESYAAFTQDKTDTKKTAEKDFVDLSGLRDQIKILTLGHLAKTLSPEAGAPQIDLSQVSDGAVIYFRLQSLLSPQIVSILGKLLIQHLNYLAGTAHRSESGFSKGRLVPTYLDEFASFACPEFADLISKARSAGFALHFSHQSIGDLSEISKGFLNQITDNSATKIILRINDPDSAEFFARSFGTKLYQKVTQRITNVKEVDSVEVVGEGTQREAHRFRASPDVFKTLPTGVGSVLIAHGSETPHGGSSVFKIKFPKLEPKEV